MTSRFHRVFNVSCKTNERESNVFAELVISQVTRLLRAFKPQACQFLKTAAYHYIRVYDERYRYLYEYVECFL